MKALLLVLAVSLVCVTQVSSSASAAATVPPSIVRVSAPSSVNVGESFQVSVKLGGIFTGSEARVQIFDPSVQRTLTTSRTYGGTRDGTVGVVLSVTAPGRAGDWCLKAILEFAPKAGSKMTAVDQEGFCVNVLGRPSPSPTPTPTPTPTPPPRVEVRTDWAVGRVWMVPEHRSPLSTVPYINEGEGVVFHAMIHLRSVEVTPPEYTDTVMPYISSQVNLILDGSVRSDLYPPETLDAKMGTVGWEVKTRSIVGKDGGKMHSFGFRVTSSFLDPESRNNENATQFIVAGPPSARIVGVSAPNSTVVGRTVNINVTVQWAALFGADLRVLLIDPDGNRTETREKPISGASTADAFTFTVTAPSRPMLWNLRAEVWTRTSGSTTWRHDTTDWSRDFTIQVTEQRFTAKIKGVGGPGTVTPGSRFTVSAIVSYDFTAPTRTRIMANNETVTDTLSGAGTKTYTINMTAPTTTGSLAIRVQVEYQRESGGSWQHDTDNWYKTLTVNVSPKAAAWPIPDWWTKTIEKPFNDLVIKPLQELLGIK